VNGRRHAVVGIFMVDEFAPCHAGPMSQHQAITGLGLAKAALCGQPKRMMAKPSPKHLLVMLLAVFLTAGFSLSAAQASVMSAKMTMAADEGMTMPSGMGKMVDAAMNGDCKACIKGAGDNGNPMHCPPSCISPVLAVLPQDFTVKAVPPMQQPSGQPAASLHGRSSLPDPYPPRPRA